jgi:hypothetical protein
MRKLFLDDIRYPKPNTGFWRVVRNYDQAVKAIKSQGLPDYISFDHDLGEDQPTGYDLAKWIEYSVLYGMITWNPNFKFGVHSANPVGGKNIQCRLDNFIAHMRVQSAMLDLEEMYGGIWTHNIREGTLTDSTTDMMFLVDDV